MNSIITLANIAAQSENPAAILIDGTDFTNNVFLEALTAYGIKMALCGMGIAVGAVVIVACIYALIKKAPKTTPSSMSESLTQSCPPVSEKNDKLIAAITAAIYTYRQQNGETGNFRVVSFRRR